MATPAFHNASAPGSSTRLPIFAAARLRISRFRRD